MTSIDFYFNAADRLEVACRLAGKAAAQKKRMLIYAPGADLAGTSWQLTGITLTNPPFQGSVPSAEQPTYTIAFAADGTFSAIADCNTLNGTWTAGSGGSLTLRTGASTIVACDDDSLGDLYVIGLNNVASYAIASKQLTLTTDDGGTLVYKAAS